MNNLEIIEMQNAIISNMAQINAELHSRLEQYEAVAQNEKTAQLEEATGNMIGRLFITVAGLCLSVATFYFGRQSVTKADGKAAGALETDLRYIKESVGRIEGQLNRDVQRLEGRIDEISNQLAGISNTAGRAHESAKSAHNRIDEHLEREHNIQTDRRRSNAET